MSENIASISKLSVPLGWLAAILMFVGGIVLWLGNLQSRVDYIDRDGNPTTTLSAISSLTARLNADEGSLSQIQVNSNRLTKIETELSIVEKELDGSSRQRPP